MAKITLDSKTFQALASTTRLTVLRALDERRKTLTELARDLQLNKATVHEHLQLLTGAGLVRKRDDEGRKWIYYELTWTGEKLLHPQETTTFNVLLGLAVAAAGGGVVMLGRGLGLWLTDRQLAMTETTLADDDGQPPAQPSAFASQTTSPDDGQGSGGSGTGEGGSTGGAQGSTQGTNTMPPAADSDRLTESALRDDGPPPEDLGAGTFDDGGWMGLALLMAATIFMVLALALRRHLTPGRFQPAKAAAADAEMGAGAAADVSSGAGSAAGAGASPGTGTGADPRAGAGTAGNDAAGGEGKQAP